MMLLFCYRRLTTLTVALMGNNLKKRRIFKENRENFVKNDAIIFHGLETCPTRTGFNATF